MSAWSSEPTVAAREGALLGLLDAVVASQLDVWLRCPTPVSDASYDDGLRVLALALLREWDAALA